MFKRDYQNLNLDTSTFTVEPPTLRITLTLNSSVDKHWGDKYRQE